MCKKEVNKQTKECCGAHHVKGSSGHEPISPGQLSSGCWQQLADVFAIGSSLPSIAAQR